MPIKHSGNHVCENCGKLFEWKHFELSCQRLTSSSYTVETIPSGTLVHAFVSNHKGGYNVSVNCPYCNEDNFFTFDED